MNSIVFSFCISKNKTKNTFLRTKKKDFPIPWMPGVSEQKILFIFKLQIKLWILLLAPSAQQQGLHHAESQAWDLPRRSGARGHPRWGALSTSLRKGEACMAFQLQQEDTCTLSSPRLVFVLRLMADSLRKSNESHIWVRFQSKPQIAFVNIVYSAVVSTSGWEKKYLMGNKIFKRLEK